MSSQARYEHVLAETWGFSMIVGLPVNWTALEGGDGNGLASLALINCSASNSNTID